MEGAIEGRVRRAGQELLDKHIGPLIVLLAEAGVAPEEQRRRLDRMVRSLQAPRLEPTIFEGGRRVPSAVDEAHDPPVIRLNSELLARLDDEDLLGALARPVSTVLEVPAMNVTLMLQSRDEKQLKNLYHSAARRLGDRAIRPTSIPAVVERRLRSFGRRLMTLVSRLSPREGSRPGLQNPAAFQGWLMEQPMWPDWEAVAHRPFTRSTVEAVEMALVGARVQGQSEALVELCWDSLDLSPPSIVRHAARVFRAQAPELLDGALLTAVAASVSQEDPAQLADISSWPSYDEIHDAWRQLHVRETAAFGLPAAASAAPPISALDPPQRTMGLSRPEGLPFELPLVAWTLRETQALRDLLLGFGQTIPPSPRSPAAAVSPDALPGEAPLMALGLGQPMNLELRPAEMPGPQQSAREELAWRACLQHLETSFTLIEGEEQRWMVLRRLRACYDEVFAETRSVWERRFQTWEQLPELEAFRALVRGLAAVVEAPILVDPFVVADDLKLRQEPAFSVVAPIEPGAARATLRLPLSVLLSCLREERCLRLRVVELESIQASSCQWVGDVEIEADLFEALAPLELLAAVARDAVQLALMPPGSRPSPPPLPR